MRRVCGELSNTKAVRKPRFQNGRESSTMIDCVVLVVHILVVLVVVDFRRSIDVKKVK